MGLTTTGKAGFAIAAVGVAHFVAPEAFGDVTSRAFPEDTATWVLRDGASETAIGLALMAKPTRKLGLLALVGYVGWLGFNGYNVSKANRD